MKSFLQQSYNKTKAQKEEGEQLTPTLNQIEVLKGEAQGPPGEKKSSRNYSFSGVHNSGFTPGKGGNGDKSL